jgi:hypothetical protein
MNMAFQPQSYGEKTQPTSVYTVGNSNGDKG